MKPLVKTLTREEPGRQRHQPRGQRDFTMSLTSDHHDGDCRAGGLNTVLASVQSAGGRFGLMRAVNVPGGW